MRIAPKYDSYLYGPDVPVCALAACPSYTPPRHEHPFPEASMSIVVTRGPKCEAGRDIAPHENEPCIPKIRMLVRKEREPKPKTRQGQSGKPIPIAGVDYARLAAAYEDCGWKWGHGVGLRQKACPSPEKLRRAVEGLQAEAERDNSWRQTGGLLVTSTTVELHAKLHDAYEARA